MLIDVKGMIAPAIYSCSS